MGGLVFIGPAYTLVLHKEQRIRSRERSLCYRSVLHVCHQQIAPTRTASPFKFVEWITHQQYASKRCATRDHAMHIIFISYRRFRAE